MSQSEPATDAISTQIADEVLRIHRESYGKGAERADVVVCEDVVYVMLDELELLPNESFMIEAGEGNAVVEIRSRYQEAIETTFRAAVERATGRRVVSFASVTKLSPNYAVEIFRLGPRKEAP
jgi:uncharacterized protein YbcI